MVEMREAHQRMIGHLAESEEQLALARRIAEDIMARHDTLDSARAEIGERKEENVSDVAVYDPLAIADQILQMQNWT